MTWTYDATATTTLAKVRRRIGDTNTNSQLLADEEIADFLDEAGDDIYSTAVACVDAILAKLARDVDRSNLGMSATRSQQEQHYKDLRELLVQRRDAGATPSLTGVSVSEAEDEVLDDDFIQPGFIRGHDDNG